MEELDLKEIFNIFWSKKEYILVATVLALLLGVIYSYLFVTPKYKSYTTLVLATSTEDSSSKAAETITSTDISLNNNLVATYSELIKSKAVVRQVISNLGIDDSEDTIKGSISVSAVKSTQLIEIDVYNEDSYKAKLIANEVARVFSAKVAEIYNINNIRVVDEAEEPTSPSNVNRKKDIGMFTVIGFALGCIYAFIVNMIDTTVKGKEDIERRIGLTVLVDIPECNFEESLKAMNKIRRGGEKNEKRNHNA